MKRAKKLDTKTSEVKAHAEFSASGSHRWLNCPGSHELSKKAPPVPESSYAAEGTKAHACLEFLLKNRSALREALPVARKTYPQEMVEHAHNAVLFILGIQAETGGEILSETRVDSSYFTCTGQFGTLDAAVVEEFGTLTVIDYKYGAGILVDPAGHDGKGDSQLVYYALALSHVYQHNFSDVQLVVIQPRAYSEDGETVRIHRMTIDELMDWHGRFREGVMETSDPDAALKPGSWCRFCPAATICPELKEKAFKEAQVVFADNEVQSLPEPTMIVLPDLGKILRAGEKLEAWLTKVREHALHVLERGGKVDGYKLVAKRSTRKWTNAEKAAKEAQSKFGTKVFTEPALLSPAQFEKATKGVKGADEWLSARVSAESSGTTMVPESDKRPAVKQLKEVFT